MLFRNRIVKYQTQYETGRLYAPVSGIYVPLENIPDETFASGLLGKGVGIEPNKEIILSPAEGVVSAIAQTIHAIGITTSDGAEILIHIGLNTVYMKGAGFTCHVKKDQPVIFGQKLISFNIRKIHTAGYPATVLFTVTNSNNFKQVTFDPPEELQYLEPIGNYANS